MVVQLGHILLRIFRGQAETVLPAISIAFHDDVDVTDWMLYSNPVVYSGHGSSQGEGRVYAADGRVLASYSVQAMIRPLAASPDSLGGSQRAM